jgi:magnesium-transporting ATPase (P-type)
MASSSETEPLLTAMEAASPASPLINSDATDHNDNQQQPLSSSQQQQSSQQIHPMRWVLAAHILCFIALLLVFGWTHMLGGFSWQTGHSKQVFNWHPVLMVIAFAFITVATLSFRTNIIIGTLVRRHSDPLQQLDLHNLQKRIHGMAWLIAALCASFGLVAVFKSHNDPVSGYLSNWYSLHSWTGMMVILMYVIQFGMGFLAFWKPIAYFTTPTARKQKILQFHKTVGPILYCTITLTILLGIQEKEKFVVCSYPVVDKPDSVIPFSNLGRLPVACRISHLLAFVIVFTAICTSMALRQPGDNTMDDDDDRSVSGQRTDGRLLSSERDTTE